MRRARGVCPMPGCDGVPVFRGKCETHRDPPWSDSEQRRQDRGVAPAGERTLRRLVRRRARGRCERCGRAAQLGEVFVVDHVVPVALGGAPLDPDNAELVCPDCDEPKTAADLAAMRATQVPPAR